MDDEIHVRFDADERLDINIILKKLNGCENIDKKKEEATGDKDAEENIIVNDCNIESEYLIIDASEAISKDEEYSNIVDAAVKLGIKYVIDKPLEINRIYPLSQKIICCDGLIDYIKKNKIDGFEILEGDEKYPKIPFELTKEKNWKSSGMTDDEEDSWTEALNISFTRHSLHFNEGFVIRRMLFTLNKDKSVKLVHLTAKKIVDANFWNSFIKEQYKSMPSSISSTENLSENSNELGTYASSSSPNTMNIDNDMEIIENQSILSEKANDINASDIKEKISSKGPNLKKRRCEDSGIDDECDLSLSIPDSKSLTHSTTSTEFKEMKTNETKSFFDVGFPNQLVYYIQELYVNYIYRRSDETLKENIKSLYDFPEFLSKLSNLDGKFYNYIGDTRLCFGFIAQEVEKLFPDLVKKDSDGKYSVDYEGIIALEHQFSQDMNSRLKLIENKAVEWEKIYAKYIKQIEEFLGLFSLYMQENSCKNGNDQGFTKIALEIADILGEKGSQVRSIEKIISSTDSNLYKKWVKESLDLAETEKGRTPGGYFFNIYKNHLQGTKHIKGKGNPHEPRDYQIEIIEKALKLDKALISLPTGTGKTLIAANVLKGIIKPKSNEKGIFIVRDRILGAQQQYVLRSEGNENWRVGCFIGGSSMIDDKNCESINSSSWKRIISDWDVAVITSGLLENVIKESNNEFDWKPIKIIVFDEIHNATKKHPFANLLRYFEQESPSTKIYGFTATPASADSLEQTKISCDILLGLIGGDIPAEFIGIHSQDKRLSNFYSDIDVKLIYIENNQEQDDRVKELRDSMFNLIDSFVNSIDEIIQNDKIFDDVGDKPITKNKIGNKLIKYAEKIEILCRNNKDYINLSSTCWFLSKMASLYQSTDELDDNIFAPLLTILAEANKKKVVELLKIETKNGPKSNIYELIKPILNSSYEYYTLNMIPERIENLLSILEEAYKNKSTYQAIIRVKTRFAAHWLRHWLKKCKKEFIRNPILLLGQKSGQGSIDSFSLSQSKENIQTFKENQSNILIATSIIQEGVDVQNCDLVICIGGAVIASGKDFRQLKGRARDLNGKFYVIVKGSQDRYFYEKGRRQAENQEDITNLMSSL